MMIKKKKKKKVIVKKKQDPNLPRPTTGVKVPCALHPHEHIKYFCRDSGCKKGICPNCIFEHTKHDFIAANDVAVFEIKQALKSAALAC